MTVALAFLLGQTWFGKPGDPLMRPGVPDAYLIRQQWVQRDLRLTADEMRRLGEEASRGFPGPGNPRFDPSKVKYDVMLGLNKKHEKRLRELSLWQADVFAFSNEWVQDQVGLVPTTRKRVDDACRTFYVWWQAESDRLNRVKPRPSGPMSKTTMQPMLSPDPLATLQKLSTLRKELRRMVPPSAHAKLAALKGRAPHTWTPFGFPRSGPSILAPPVRSVLFNPRVHEELGFSMRQSRLTLEGLQNARDVEATVDRVRDGLTPQQRKRLDQLELQALGTRALLYHDVLTQLKVDPNKLDSAYVQITKLQNQSMEIQNDEQAAYSDLWRMRSSNPTAAREREEAIRKRYAGLRKNIESWIDLALMDMLDQTQRREFKKMLGPPVPGVSLK